MNLWVMLAAVELGLIVVGLLLAAWVGQVLAGRRDRRAMRALVDRVTGQKERRAQDIRAFLQQNFDLAEERLDQQAAAILREELRLYQRFVNLYLRRDAGAAANFQIALESCVEPYWRLEGGTPNIEFVAPEDSETESFAGIDQSELLQLRGEVQRLQWRSNHLGDQLRLALTHLSRMLDEYSSLFEGGTLDDLSGASLISEAGEFLAERDARPAETGADRASAGEPATARGGDAEGAAAVGPDGIPGGEPAPEPAFPGAGQAGSVPVSGRHGADAGEGASDTATETSGPNHRQDGAEVQATDELMATLDANLPEPPEEGAELASAASETREPLAEAETDALPATERDDAERAASPERDRERERVTIVQKDRVDDLRA